MTSDIVWKPIPGESAEYEINRRGDVRAVRAVGITPLKWHMRNGCPYAFVTFYRPSTPISKWTKRARAIHRLVAEAFVPNPDNKPCVNHKDLNKLNNCADNLEWVTALDNHWHASERGAGGSVHTSARRLRKLSDADVADIRRLLATGNYNMRELSDHYGVSPTMISGIWRNTQRAIPGEPVKPPGFRTAFYHRQRKAGGPATTLDPQRI